MRDESKVLVIGLKGLPPPARCLDWGEVAGIENIADWDYVLMDLTTLQGEKDPRWPELSRNIREGRMGLDRMLLGLRSGATVVAIIGQVVRTSAYTNRWWMPEEVAHHALSGDTVEVMRSDFEAYFKEVRHWDTNYAWTRLVGETWPMAASRAKTAIAIQWRPLGVTRGGLYILPPVTSVSHEEGMLIVMKDVCRLQVGPLPPPAWIEGFPVPKQDAVLQELKELENEAKGANDKLQASSDRLAKMQGIRRLLYESGDVLRQVVLDALEELGAKVRSREDRGNEDGIIDCGFGVGVLEAKKSAKGCAKADVRQLDEWVGNLLHAGEEAKGLLVLNHFAELPPNERGKPFEHNVIDLARKSRKKSFCLMTSSQLFEEVCRVRSGLHQGPDVLRRMFEADGVFETARD